MTQLLGVVGAAFAGGSLGLLGFRVMALCARKPTPEPELDVAPPAPEPIRGLDVALAPYTAIAA